MNSYDVIIIGAGLGGLVCGCYLVRNKKKVLIVEKNNHPGGCCTSFQYKGHVFDSAAHTLGGMGENGPIRGVLEDFKILEKLRMHRLNPSYILNVAGYELPIYNNFSKTIYKLQEDFPEERKGLASFFNEVNTATSIKCMSLRKIPFVKIVDQYVKNDDLKTIILAPLLGNTGVCPTKISTFTAIKFYQQFVMDGGYHLSERMQELSNVFASYFQKNGGELQYSSMVDSIIIDNNSAKGVLIGDKTILSKKIISNIDAKATFNNLVKPKNFSKVLLKKINDLKLSSSMFILYMGLKQKVSTLKTAEVTTWYVKSKNILDVYQNVFNETPGFYWWALNISKDQKSIQAFTIAPTEDLKYWNKNADVWKEKFIEEVLGRMPEVRNKIDFVLKATPQTIEEWTGNQMGASCGWASHHNQFNVDGFNIRTEIKDLYLCGHWTTTTLGLPGVVNIGKSTASLIS